MHLSSHIWIIIKNCPGGVYNKNPMAESPTKKFFSENERQEALKEYNKTFRLERKEDIREYSKKYKEEHKEELKEYNKKYREEHREDLRVNNRKHNKTEKRKAYKRKYSQKTSE